MDDWKLLLIGMILIIDIVYLSVKVNQRKQRKRIEEARLRGIKKALVEKRQYAALDKIEDNETKPKKAESYQINEGKIGNGK